MLGGGAAGREWALQDGGWTAKRLGARSPSPSLSLPAAAAVRCSSGSLFITALIGTQLYHFFSGHTVWHAGS